MPTKKVNISPEVAAALRNGEWRGWLFVLNAGQLDRHLYLAVNKVLEALGGRWDRRLRGHMLSIDGRNALEAALEAGHAVDEKRSAEQFFTPPELASSMARLVVLPGDHVLEPSAGRGALITAALEAGADFITAVEGHKDLAERLARELALRHGCGVFWEDFLKWNPAAALPIDVVLMNPPFSGGQDIAHVRRAFDFLRPGGKLAAVMSTHFTFARDRFSQEFRELIGFPGPEAFRDNQHAAAEVGAATAHGTVRMLPAGTFKDEGTSVNTILLTVTKGGES